MPTSPCIRCSKSTSDAAAFLLSCSECSKCWHHRCHIPPVQDSELVARLRATQNGDVDNGFSGWICRRCTKEQNTRPAKPLPQRRRASGTSNEPILVDSDIELDDGRDSLRRHGGGGNFDDSGDVMECDIEIVADAPPPPKRVERVVPVATRPPSPVRARNSADESPPDAMDVEVLHEPRPILAVPAQVKPPKQQLERRVAPHTGRSSGSTSRAVTSTAIAQTEHAPAVKAPEMIPTTCTTLPPRPGPSRHTQRQASSNSYVDTSEDIELLKARPGIPASSVKPAPLRTMFRQPSTGSYFDMGKKVEVSRKISNPPPRRNTPEPMRRKASSRSFFDTTPERPRFITRKPTRLMSFSIEPPNLNDTPLSAARTRRVRDKSQNAASLRSKSPGNTVTSPGIPQTLDTDVRMDEAASPAEIVKVDRNPEASTSKASTPAPAHTQIPLTIPSIPSSTSTSTLSSPQPPDPLPPPQITHRLTDFLPEHIKNPPTRKPGPTTSARRQKFVAQPKERLLKAHTEFCILSKESPHACDPSSSLPSAPARTLPFPHDRIEPNNDTSVDHIPSNSPLASASSSTNDQSQCAPSTSASAMPAEGVAVTEPCIAEAVNKKVKRLDLSQSVNTTKRSPQSASNGSPKSSEASMAHNSDSTSMVRRSNGLQSDADSLTRNSDQDLSKSYSTHEFCIMPSAGKPQTTSLAIQAAGKSRAPMRVEDKAQKQLDFCEPQSCVISSAEKQHVTTSAVKAASETRRRNEAKYPCPVPGCGTTFTRHINLKGHIRAHNEEKPFVCTFLGCDKRFAHSHDHKRHQALHSSEENQSLTCRGCKKSFSRADNLRRHLRLESSADCREVYEVPRHQGSPSSTLLKGDPVHQGPTDMLVADNRIIPSLGVPLKVS